MREDTGIIISNELIAKDVYKMVIKSNLGSEMCPGQFVNIKVDGYFLRRPISISQYDENAYTIVYKVVGDGTSKLSQMEAGRSLNVVGPCGHGFDIDDVEPLLVGGGVGVPPLLQVAKEFNKRNVNADVVLGFNSKEDVFYEEEFKKLGCNVYIATMDGSYCIKGTVMDAIKEHSVKSDYLYSCGPMPMLKALDNAYTKGYLSFESRMACGMGACMGCVCKDKKDHDIYYRICKEGPVFEIGKVDF